MYDMRSIIFCFTSLFFICAGYAKGNPITLHSPDSVFRIRINCDDSISYNLFYRDKEIIKPSHIGLEVQKGEMRKELFSDIEKVRYDYNRGKIHPLYSKFKELDDSYNEVTIDFDLFSVIYSGDFLMKVGINPMINLSRTSVVLKIQAI